MMFACAACVGCSDQLETYPITGKVQFENGNPVVVGNVEFQSIEHKINARGEIQRDGTFQLTTFNDNDGAVAGEHKCVVIQTVMVEHIPGHRGSVIGVVNPKHASYATSGLSFTVAEDAANEVTLVVDGVIKKQPPEGTEHQH